MDKFRALSVFMKAAELESFSATAQELGLSKAAVTKNIRELEESLGVQLFNRSTRSVKLSAAGRVYAERVARYTSDLSSLEAEIAEMNTRPQGKIRVTAPMSFGLVKLSPKIPKFLEAYPDISLDLEFSDVHEDLAKRKFDLAIRGSAQLEDSTLVARRLTHLDRVMCASPEFLKRVAKINEPSDIADIDCIVYSLSSSKLKWTFQRGERIESVSVSSRYWVNNSLAVKHALLGGLGLSLIPLVYIEEELQAGKLVQVLSEWSSEKQDVYAIFNSDAFMPKRLRLFIDFLIEELK